MPISLRIIYRRKNHLSRNLLNHEIIIYLKYNTYYLRLLPAFSFEHNIVVTVLGRVSLDGYNIFFMTNQSFTFLDCKYLKRPFI